MTIPLPCALATALLVRYHPSAHLVAGRLSLLPPASTIVKFFTENNVISLGIYRVASNRWERVLGATSNTKRILLRRRYAAEMEDRSFDWIATQTVVQRLSREFHGSRWDDEYQEIGGGCVLLTDRSVEQSWYVPGDDGTNIAIYKKSHLKVW